MQKLKISKLWTEKNKDANQKCLVGTSSSLCECVGKKGATFAGTVLTQPDEGLDANIFEFFGPSFGAC